LKWAPGSLAAGKLTLGGEYHFKKKNSLELFFGFPTGTHQQFNYDNNKSSLDSKAASTLAGYRYYFSKNGGTGLYIEPYFKYLHHQASGFLHGDINGESASFDTHTDYKGVGGGLQFGAQFFIAKTVSIDFFFLGPEANSSTFSLSATTRYSGFVPGFRFGLSIGIKL
jgi:outer membrane autotransporter protein